MFQAWQTNTICGIMAASAALSLTPSASAQAPCIGQVTATYSEGFPSGIATEIDPSVLLEETDDPAKIINLVVVVHDKAIVTINGEPTFTKGVVRPYIVRGLKPGSKYKFKVEGLHKNETGAEYYATDEVTVAAGDAKQVVLHLRRRNRAPQPPAPAAPAVPPPAA